MRRYAALAVIVALVAGCGTSSTAVASATPTPPAPVATQSANATSKTATPTSESPKSLGTGLGPFVFDVSSSKSRYAQEHQYLSQFIKPCPRAGCETATLDPRFAWILGDWETPIPPAFQPCLASPDGDACYRAVMGP
jgi:hypothetical protein